MSDEHARSPVLVVPRYHLFAWLYLRLRLRLRLHLLARLRLPDSDPLSIRFRST
jgi:hypothetical protein